MGIGDYEEVVTIAIDEIHPFKNHPFKVRDDEKMEELIKSISSQGILTPVTVRTDEDGQYEMISGHRRMHAAKENDLEDSNIKSNHIISAKMQDANMGYDCDMMSEMDAYDEIIKENISFDDLLVAYPYEIETIKGIKQLILETVLNKNESMVIASNTYPVALVKSKFLKLNYSHIEYVMDCFKSNTSKVKNIKKYLLAALFNAPSTMDSYYRAEVNHDMPYMTMARLEA